MPQKEQTSREKEWAEYQTRLAQYKEELEKYEKESEEYKRELAEYKKSVRRGFYEINARYDRSTLAITGVGFALFATLLRSDTDKLLGIPLGEPSTWAIHGILLTFIISITLIMMRQFFGAEAHRNTLAAINRGAITAAGPAEVGGWPGKIADYCLYISAFFMLAGLIGTVGIVICVLASLV